MRLCRSRVVEEQIKKDTDFSTVEVPNPEFKETLSLGIKLAQKIETYRYFKKRYAVLLADGSCHTCGYK